MENNFKNIDKHIYSASSDITKGYKHILWAFICTLIGGVALWLYMNYEYIAQHPTWSGLTLGVVLIGGFAACTIICYYTFGDCHSPYYKPTKEQLCREECYFSSSNANKVSQSINEKNIAALDKLPKSIVPQVVVIKYSNDDDSVMAIQAFDNGDGLMTPITDIVICNKLTQNI